jgi:hypothetical protein
MQYVLTTTLDDVKISYELPDLKDNEVMLINFDVVDGKLVKVI